MIVVPMVWPRIVQAIEEHAQGLSPPDDITSPIEVIPVELRHRLWLQICFDELYGMGQRGCNLNEEERMERFASFLEALKEFRESIEFLDLTLDKMLTMLVLPSDEEQRLVHYMSDRLGLESRTTSLASKLPDIDDEDGRSCAKTD